jgi:small subunit ribosomal protein S6
MKHYELVLMLHPDQSEQASAIVGRYIDMIKAKGGIIHRQEDWGRKSLAYPINKLHKAHYALLNIEFSPADLKELTDGLRFNDFVLRYLITNMDEAVTTPSVMMEPRKVNEHQDN